MHRHDGDFQCKQGMHLKEITHKKCTANFTEAYIRIYGMHVVCHTVSVRYFSMTVTQEACNSIMERAGVHLDVLQGESEPVSNTAYMLGDEGMWDHPKTL